MIIHNNIPVITDVFLRQPEKDLLKNFTAATASSSEYDADKTILDANQTSFGRL